MNAWLHAFHFLQPWWLLGLLGLPIVGWVAAHRSSVSPALARLVDAALLPSLLRGSERRRPLAAWLFAGAWTCAILALAGPSWNRQPQGMVADRAAQVVALSLSSHMLVRDVAPSRLDRARLKVRDLFAANRDGLNALIAWSGEPFVVAPLTSDAGSLDELLGALSPDTMPVDGNDAAAAIERAVALVDGAKVTDASLVLVTDQADAAALQAARKARAAGVRVSVLGVGSARGAPLADADGSLQRDQAGQLEMAARDDQSLAALAAAGGGKYVAMTPDHADIQALHAQLRLSQASTSDDSTTNLWLDRGPWLLLPLLLLAAMAFRRGLLLLLALTVLPALPTTAHAGSWTDLWQRGDQQAAAALRRGDARQAQAMARDPAWRAAAAYRAGDYAAAAQTLAGVPGAAADYNRGNALARAGDYAAALQAYDRALALNPQLADAKANRDAVADWLRKQQSKKEQKSPSQAGEQDKQDDSAQSTAQLPQPGNQGKFGQDKPGEQQPEQDQPEQGQPGQGQPSSQQPSSKPGQGQESPANPRAGAASAGPQHSATPATPPAHTDGDSQRDQSAPQPSPAASASTTPAAKPSATTSETSPARATSVGSANDVTPLSPREQAAEQAKTAQAQQAVREQMDKALANPAAKRRAPVHDLGAAPVDDPQAKLPVDVRRALQSVPDDPGALLRRKFELEYQQRHGRSPAMDDQP